MRHTRRLVLPLALAVMLGAAPSWAAPKDDGGWLVLKQPAVDFTLKDLDGHTLTDDDLAGRIVIVDFWATWCGPCVKELPDLAAFQQRHRAEKDLLFLSAAATEDADTVRTFAREHKIPYPVYLGDDLLGPYEIYAFPTKLIIDATGGAPGIVRYRREGYTPIEAIEQKIAELRNRPH